MKRKIFTLLAAFLALAAFQSNAQISQKPYIPYTLSGLNDSTAAGNAFQNIYPDSIEAAKSAVSGALTLESNVIAYKSTAPVFGNKADYFAVLEAEILGNPIPRVYEFYTYVDTANLGSKLSFTYGVNNDVYETFELVRFSPQIPGSGGYAQSTAFDLLEGGYLAPPQGVPGKQSGRLLVVRELATGKLSLMSYGELLLPTNASKYWPVWVKGTAVGARWARSTDFESFPDFIQINLANGKQLEVEKTKYFKILKTNSHFVGPSYGHDGREVLSYDGDILGRQEFIELFSFISPEKNKVISVARNRNALGVQATTSNNVFGDSLVLVDPLTCYGVVLSGERTENQQFGIWLEIDGTMSLYPYEAWTYRYGMGINESTRIPNLAITTNRHIIDNEDVDSWKHFRIQQYIYDSYKDKNCYVVGPTKLAESTMYNYANVNFEDVTAYNTIPSKRYFYLQTKTKGKGFKDVSNLVLDVVEFVGSDNLIHKKVVLTDKEKAHRSAESYNDLTYYNVPYDSMNLSAHWMVEEVLARDIDPLSNSDERIGYRFTNEEGDVLMYDNGSFFVLPMTSAEYRAYLDPSPVTNTLGYASKDVWKTLTLPNGDQSGARPSFFMSNISGAAVFASTVANNYVVKDIKDIRGWSVVIDTTNADFDPRICPSYFSSLADPNEPNPRKSYWEKANYDAVYNACFGNAYGANSFAEVAGVVQRNVGYYNPLDAMTGGCNSIGLDPKVDATKATIGLELELIEIDYTPYTRKANDEHENVKHDSLYYGTEIPMWDRYAVDSLFNYMYQKPGVYTVVEAIGHNDIFKIDQEGLIYPGLPDTETETDRIVVEMIDSLIWAELDNIGAVEGTTDPYKWFHMKDKKTDKYLTLDIVRPVLDPYISQYGFTFTEEYSANAARFRFYQPLVDDKANRYFILETVVPEDYYEERQNGLPQADLSRGRGYEIEGNSIDGMTVYVVISTSSKRISIVTDPREATRWDFTKMEYFENCRRDYIDNDFLADTKMYGAPLTAERWKLLPDEPNQIERFSGSFLTETAYERKPTAQDEEATFVLVPAAKIKHAGGASTQGNIVTPFYAPDRKKVTTFASTINNFVFDNARRDIQLYYVKKIKKGEKDQFLTVTSKNIHVQELIPNMLPTVSGDLLEFQDAYSYAASKPNEIMLQMFAIYGKLGLDEDKDPLEGCIATAREFTYGQFVFVPAAAYKVNIQNPAVTPVIVQNEYLGNTEAEDDFKVSMYYSEDPKDPKSNYKLFVTPGGSEGYPASEYVFTYEPFVKPFDCLNFIYDYESQVAIPCSDRTSDASFHSGDYSDPSQQWNIEKVTDYAYSFAPINLFTNTQRPVEQEVLTEDRYMYLIDEAEDETAYGDKGYLRSVIAMKKYDRDIHTGRYTFSDDFYSDMSIVTIDQITNKYPGDVHKVNEKTRVYNGDSAIDYFYKFEEGEVVAFDWAIIESIYKDRYLWAAEYDTPKVDEMKAINDSTKSRYLTLKPTKVDKIAECDEVVHYIPYYHIVYTDIKTGRQYYLELDQAGNAEFVYMSIADQELLVQNADNDDYKPGMKFCFPYKMRAYNRLEYVGEGRGEDPNKDNSPETNPYYDYGKVFVQSMTNFEADGLTTKTKPVLVKVIASSGDLGGEVLPNLFGIDYTTNLDATTWFFGDNGASDDVWIRLDPVPGDTKAYLRDATRPVEEFVVVNPVADNNGVYFARLTHKNDIPNVTAGGGELTFQFVDSAILGSYDRKPIWYYNIINEDGKFLTSAGFAPGGTPSAAKYEWLGEGLAYFDDEMASDPTYKQLFGLKWKKVEEGEDDPYHFWVVAGVDSTQENTANSPYYYLSNKNNKLTFRYGGGTAKAEAEGTALFFEVGKIDEDKNYTDIEDNTGDVLAVYGGEGNVQVVNATGIIELYSVDGRIIKSVLASGSEVTIPAPAGVVIVKNGSNVAKVVVK